MRASCVLSLLSPAKGKPRQRSAHVWKSMVRARIPRGVPTDPVFNRLINRRDFRPACGNGLYLRNAAEGPINHRQEVQYAKLLKHAYNGDRVSRLHVPISGGKTRFGAIKRGSNVRASHTHPHVAVGSSAKSATWNFPRPAVRSRLKSRRGKRRLIRSAH